MQHEYWVGKTRANVTSMARIREYLERFPGQEEPLQRVMEAAEAHYSHTKGTFAHEFIRLVMDEVEKEKTDRVWNAVELARKNGIDFRQALERMKQQEARRQV